MFEKCERTQLELWLEGLSRAREIVLGRGRFLSVAGFLCGWRVKNYSRMAGFSGFSEDFGG